MRRCCDPLPTMDEALTSVQLDGMPDTIDIHCGEFVIRAGSGSPAGFLGCVIELDGKPVHGSLRSIHFDWEVGEHARVEFEHVLMPKREEDVP